VRTDARIHVGQVELAAGRRHLAFDQPRGDAMEAQRLHSYRFGLGVRRRAASIVVMFLLGWS
jgi:hypothetical protein